MRRIDLQLFNDGDGGNNEKTFTQAELDAIIGERLARERKNYADYEDLKAITAELEEFGFQGDPKAIREAIRAQKEQFKKQQELEALQKEAKDTGTTPELLSEIKALKAEIAEFKSERQARKQAEEEQKKAAEAYQQQFADFAKKYPDIDLEKLGKDEKFTRFAKRSHPSLTLIEVYEDYVDMIGGAESEAAKKIMANIERSTSSGKEKGTDGGTYGLTPAQLEIAKEAGMTAKEYADYRKRITR